MVTSSKIRFEVQDIGEKALFVQGSPVKVGQVLTLYPEQAEAYSFLKPLDPLPSAVVPVVAPKPKAPVGPAAPLRTRVLPGGGVSFSGNGVITSRDRDAKAPVDAPASPPPPADGSGQPG
jgi:hypothetical protein